VQASVAKLETSVAYVGDMLELKVYGFNEKLPVLLSKILSAARSFMPTDDRYQVSGITGMFVWISFIAHTPFYFQIEFSPPLYIKKISSPLSSI
jgi:hypothetical protein